MTRLCVNRTRDGKQTAEESRVRVDLRRSHIPPQFKRNPDIYNIEEPKRSVILVKIFLIFSRSGKNQRLERAMMPGVN